MFSGSGFLFLYFSVEITSRSSFIAGFNVMLYSLSFWFCKQNIFSLFRYDPDILLGYEVQMHSWGYLLQRASALGVDLCLMISRVPGV